MDALAPRRSAGVQRRSGLRSEWLVGGKEKKYIRTCRSNCTEPLTALVCAASMMAGALQHRLVDVFNDKRADEPHSRQAVVIRLSVNEMGVRAARYISSATAMRDMWKCSQPQLRAFPCRKKNLAVSAACGPGCEYLTASVRRLAGLHRNLRLGVTFDHAGNGSPSNTRCSSCGRSPLFHRLARCTTR